MFVLSVTFAFDASDGPACGGNCEGDSNSVGEGFSESGLSWLGVDFLRFQKTADQRDLLDATAMWDVDLCCSFELAPLSPSKGNLCAIGDATSAPCGSQEVSIHSDASSK